jgi:hypothetical protein
MHPIKLNNEKETNINKSLSPSPNLTKYIQKTDNINIAHNIVNSFFMLFVIKNLLVYHLNQHPLLQQVSNQISLKA